MSPDLMGLTLPELRRLREALVLARRQHELDLLLPDVHKVTVKDIRQVTNEIRRRLATRAMARHV
jgi:hypothetical protein